MAKAAAVDHTIVGPDVAAVGWFPYFYRIEDMPANDYTRHPFAKPAFDKLFDSGNLSAPPAAFAGGFQEFWRQYVPSKEFRGVLCLHDVRLPCDKNGTPLSVGFEREAKPGFTPFCLSLNILNIRPGPAKVVAKYMPGEGQVEHQVLRTRSGVRIRAKVRFRIGKLGSFRMWQMTGYWAPDAWMSIDYAIESSGDVSVDFSGSYIPTQHYYVNWNLHQAHDMLPITTAQIDGFLQAGAGQLAPSRPVPVQWAGQGQTI